MLDTIVIVDENDGLADAGANRISVAIGTPPAERVTGTEMPEARVTDNCTELFPP